MGLFGGKKKGQKQQSGEPLAKMLDEEDEELVAQIQSLLAQLEQAGGNTEPGPVEDLESEEMEPEQNAQGGNMAQRAKRKQEDGEEQGADYKTIMRKLMEGEELSTEERIYVMQMMGNGSAGGGGEEMAAGGDYDREEMAVERDNSTGSDPADQRLNDNPDTTDDAVSDVGGSGAYKGKAQQQVAQLINDAVQKAVQPLQEQVDAIGEFQKEIVKGIDQTGELTKALEGDQGEPDGQKSGGQSVQKSQGRAVQDENGYNGFGDLVEALNQAVQQNGGVQKSETENPHQLVEDFGARKAQKDAAQSGGEDLGSVVGALFAKNGKDGRY